MQKRKKELNEFLDSLNISGCDYEMLEKALTHSSYTFENKLSSAFNNERLEFLGDAVLKLSASRYLLERFPDYSEGELTKIRSILVSDKVLSKIADKISISKYIKLGFHEEKMGGRERPSTLACGFEALLGALYLDRKLEQLDNMLVTLIEDEVTLIDESESKFNYKAILQEYTQANWNELPIYQTVKEDGPAHDKIFDVEVLINNNIIGKGHGKSKKIAQQDAAKEAVMKLKLVEEDREDRQSVNV